MQISVTFRHMDPSDACKEYATKKLSKLKKYLNSSFEAKVILAVDKTTQIASVNISSNSGINIQGEEQSDNLYSSIDVAVSKIERQIKKHLQKLRNYNVTKTAKMAKLNIYSPESFYEDIKEEDDVEQVVKPLVIKTTDMAAEYLTVEEAVMKLEFQKENENEEFLVFTNKDTNQINVLYLRKDGNFGLIETWDSI